MVDTPKTIADAINEVTEDDIDLVDDSEETEAEAETEETEEETTEEEEPAEEEEEEEEEGARTGDVQGEEEEEEAEPAAPEAADGDPDVFDTLTAEEIEAIKADPALNKLRKSLMRSYSKTTSEHSQLVQLGLAYRKDPKGVAKAIAESVGLSIAPAQPAAAAPAAEVDPGTELEQLFGPQIGPKVRAVFDKWAEARIGPRVAPLEQTLGQVTAQSEQARMYGEEQAFKARHKDVTPEVEKEIVALGQSGKIVPGNMTPAEYLDTLYEVVMGRRARIAAKGAVGTATKKLVKKIEANRRDREPSGVSGRGGSVKKVSRVTEAKNISEALDIAMEELDSER